MLINMVVLTLKAVNFKTITVDKTISRDDKGKAFLSETTKTAAGTRNIPLSQAVLPLAKEIVKYCGTTKYVFSDALRLTFTKNMGYRLMREWKSFCACALITASAV